MSRWREVWRDVLSSLAHPPSFDRDWPKYLALTLGHLADEENQRGLVILLLVVDHGRCWLVVTGGVKWGGRAYPPKLQPSFP